MSGSLSGWFAGQSPWEWLLALGILSLIGGVGAVLRAFLGNWRGLLPWGILLGNTLAASAIGLALKLELPNPLITAIAVGLAGGLSTFSGVAKDCFDFYHRGRLAQTGLNAVANLGFPVLGLLVISVFL